MSGFITCLWFDGVAEEAAQFYVSVFPDGRIGQVVRNPEKGPGPVGSVLTVEFEVNGHRFVVLNAGPLFSFTEAISFQVLCADQAEIDHYWAALTDGGGTHLPCGWLKDRFGVSWQVLPAELLEMTADPDAAKAARVMHALWTMGKLDLEALRAAYRGD